MESLPRRNNPLPNPPVGPMYWSWVRPRVTRTLLVQPTDIPDSLLQRFCQVTDPQDRKKMITELHEVYAPLLSDITRSFREHEYGLADISQLVSLAFFEALQLYQSVEVKPRDFWAYLQQVISPLVRSAIEKEQIQRTISLQASESVSDQGGNIDCIEDALWMRDILSHVRQILASKNPRTYRDGRLLCLLQMLQGFSEKEIVESASISRQAIQEQIKHVRRYLRAWAIS